MEKEKNSSMTSKEISEQLIPWWRMNKRRFPWRTSRDPYRILVAEVLLHRTRAEQVEPIYEEFIQKFPNCHSLAEANEYEVYRILYPLGLRWRVKLLIQMAEVIESKFDGIIPSNREQLEELPGVSHYIASAVRCFGYGIPDVILDTNTVRILGRVHGIKVTDSSRRSKKFAEMYDSILDKAKPRDFNFAMIDLGALICTPNEPRCIKCPIMNLCEFGIFQRIGGMS
jgi:A/G-specific adenine glycosylase